MAKRDGAVAHPVLDELIAIHVENMRSSPSRDEARRLNGVLIVTLGVCVAPTGNEFVSPALQSFGFFEFLNSLT